MHEDLRLSVRARSMRSSVIRDLLRLTERADVLSMAGGLPAAESFPMADLALASAEVLRDRSSVQYSSTEGLHALREWIAQRAEWAVDPAQVTITHGSQQGLDLVTRALCDPGDTVLADLPGYIGGLQVLEANGCRIVGVRVDDLGLDTDHLERLLAGGLRPKMLYTCPTFQNPTGATTGAARRRALVALADRYGFIVVEDDPYSHLRWAGEPLAPVTSMSDRSVLLSTCSKTLAPGLRLGWTIAPAWLTAAVVRLKQAADLHTSTLGQRLASNLLSRTGWFAAHVDGLVPLYRARCDALADALNRHLGAAVAFTRPEGGMFLWAQLPGVDTDALLPRALDAGVAFVPGRAFHHGGGGESWARLSFAGLDETSLDMAAHRLAVALVGVTAPSN